MAALTPLLSTPAFAQTNDFDLRWGGNVFDVFTIDGIEAWTVEDGGRIRHRDASGNWTFQTVPPEVKDTIHRIFFLPGTTGAQTGWAVGSDGSVLKTVNSGTLWQRVAQFGTAPVYDVLYSVHFMDADHGWIAGQKGIWYTENGGQAWHPALLLRIDGTPMNIHDLEWLELYEMDVVQDPDPVVVPAEGVPILGLAAAEPGMIFRSRDGRTWQVVWDIRQHCDEIPVGTCERAICVSPTNPQPEIFEAWDIEISRHPTQKLALMSGGIGVICGMIWRSSDDGTTWVKEEHECVVCGSHPCPQCSLANGYSEGDEDPVTTNLYRLMGMRTIYNLDIFDADNSAVAVGYNSQALWRNPNTGHWEDRSSFNTDYLVATNANINALFGVSTNGGNGSTGIAISTGLGGGIRRSTDGGQTWQEDYTKAEPYRSKDVDFQTSTIGWMVGQFSRIAKTTDAATLWLQAAPDPNDQKPPLHAVAFADNLRGVAVGGTSGGGLNPGVRKILYTLNGGSSDWLDASTSIIMSGGTYGSLRDVEYVPGTTTVWAAGDLGFIVKSGSTNGASWRQVLINGSQIGGFEINGLAFKDLSTGLFVGRIGNVATVYQVKVSAGPTYTWSSLPVVAHPTSGPVADLGDVAVFGSEAFVVGETLIGTGPTDEVRRGIVLKATYTGSASGGSFGSFTPISSLDQFPKCLVGENLRGFETEPVPTIPVLNLIAALADGELWVGGECGRVWHYASSIWTQHKSQTDTNMTGISFPTATTGFFVGYRFGTTSQVLVRYQ